MALCLMAFAKNRQLCPETNSDCRGIPLPYPIDISHPLPHLLTVNAPSKSPRGTRLFKLNRSQALRIPKDLAFPEGVTDVILRRSGNDLIVTPCETFWDDFFAAGPNPDFPERFPQGEYEVREAF